MDGPGQFATGPSLRSAVPGLAETPDAGAVTASLGLAKAAIPVAGGIEKETGASGCRTASQAIPVIGGQQVDGGGDDRPEGGIEAFRCRPMPMEHAAFRIRCEQPVRGCLVPLVLEHLQVIFPGVPQGGGANGIPKGDGPPPNLYRFPGITPGGPHQRCGGRGIEDFRVKQPGYEIAISREQVIDRVFITGILGSVRKIQAKGATAEIAKGLDGFRQFDCPTGLPAFHDSPLQ